MNLGLEKLLSKQAPSHKFACRTRELMVQDSARPFPYSYFIHTDPSEQYLIPCILIHWRNMNL